MQFENVAREWRCKWKDDGGGSAACKGLGTKAPAPPRHCQERPRAAARLGQPDLCTRTHIRCTYAGKASSKTLVEIADLVDEYLPKLKALEGAVVNRAVCGGCLDFKVMVTQPLEGYGPWEEAGHPPEADFIAKLKAIPGVSQVETQTITNMVL